MPDDRRARRLLLAFIVGAVLLNFPLTAVVDALTDVLHPAPAVIYLFLVWALLIGVLMLVVERRRRR